MNTLHNERSPMDNFAIYTVIENGRKSYFSGKSAGGYRCPFYIYKLAEKMIKALSENNLSGNISISEMIPLLKANCNFPADVQGKQLLRPIAEDTMARLEAEMSGYDFTPYSITLDFDKKKIGFVFNKNCPGLTLPDMEIEIDSAEAAANMPQENFSSNYRCHDAENLDQRYKDALFKIIVQREQPYNPVVKIRLTSENTARDIELPIKPEASKQLAKELNVASLDDCRVEILSACAESFSALKSCKRCAFSSLNELSAWANTMAVNGFEKKLATLAAVIEADGITDAHNALTVARNIESYEFIEAKDAGDYGYYVLYESGRKDIEDNFRDEVEDFIDFYNYGQSVLYGSGRDFIDGFAAEVADYIDYDSYGEIRAKQDGAVRTGQGYLIRRGDIQQKQDIDISM